MDPGTAPRGLVRRPVLARAGVLGLATLAAVGLSLSPAVAAPGTSTVSLDPTTVEVGASPVENGHVRPVAVPVPATTLQPVAAGYGGTVTVTVPPQLVDGGGVSAALALPDGAGGGELYESTSTDPATQLSFAALGGNRYRITLPANDGVNGPEAHLRLFGFDLRNDPGVQRLDPWYFSLTLSDGGPAAVDLTQQFFAQAWPDESASAATVAAGSSLAVTLPAGSEFRALGIPDLGHSALGLQLPGSDGLPATTPVVADAVTRGADPSTVELAVPAGTTPGRHLLTVVMSDGTDQFVATHYAYVDVVAPAVNPGLRSETGGDPASWDLLPVALGSVTALAVAGGVVRSRRAGGASLSR
ncbi:hypothetical protein [Modestobacter sp. VKM Ac-2984]|uniref:hypothetical protein n=1 Tax=Modestobacter sp. VKM Ac-2984 TaxID=3004138 RepID=UPI0022AA30AB|nr:hypothetical protein [Modestobacter sp. VKM Ac-2984]MCZ2815035.1 hypothetical protein [Modestobacter sp. VKM Ac-2984]